MQSDYPFDDRNIKRQRKALNILFDDIDRLEDALIRFPTGSKLKGESRALLFSFQKEADSRDPRSLPMTFERYHALYTMLLSLDELAHIRKLTDFDNIQDKAYRVRTDLMEIYRNCNDYDTEDLRDLSSNYSKKTLELFKKLWGKPRL